MQLAPAGQISKFRPRTPHACTGQPKIACCAVNCIASPLVLLRRGVQCWTKARTASDSFVHLVARRGPKADRSSAPENREWWWRIRRGVGRDAHLIFSRFASRADADARSLWWPQSTNKSRICHATQPAFKRGPFSLFQKFHNIFVRIPVCPVLFRPSVDYPVANIWTSRGECAPFFHFAHSTIERERECAKQGWTSAQGAS